MSTYFYSNVIWLESGYKMSPLAPEWLENFLVTVGSWSIWNFEYLLLFSTGRHSWKSQNKHLKIQYVQIDKLSKTLVWLNISKYIKGQLISKTNCQAEDSSKKRTNEFVFTFLLVCDVFSFVFWENPRPEKNVSRFTDV